MSISKSSIRSWFFSVLAIQVGALLLANSRPMMHERGSSAVVLTIKPWHPLIVVPEPDPAMYGHLLEDRAMARVHLVSLGD